jgi:hypothetical protein
MRMPSSTAMCVNLQSRTLSCRSLTVDLVRASMGGTTPISCSTSLSRKRMSIPTGSSTLSTPLRCRMPSSRRGQRRSPTSSSSFCSYRGLHHMDLWTTRRSTPCLASMRTRSHRCLGSGESLYEWIYVRLARFSCPFCF